MELILSEAHKESLSKEAKEKKPNESCALLLGDKKNDRWFVKEIFFANNIENSPVNFTISNEQLIEGYKKAEEKGLDVIGIFHSHPNSDSYPSSTDRKFMEINPVVWVIFSDTDNEFKAFLYESEIQEVTITS